MNSLTKRLLISGALFGLSYCVLAEDVTIVKQVAKLGAEPPTWVSLSGFSGEAASVLRFDLYVQGCNFTNSEGAQYQIVGSSNGNLQGRVTDAVQKRTLVSKAYSGASIRAQAHLFVDEFMTAIGRKGIGRTKIAFKHDNNGNSEIYVSDFDGNDAKGVTADGTIVAAPT